MTVSLSGLDMPWLDPAKRGRGRVRFSHGHQRGIRHGDAPMVISDMGEAFSHADGRVYSSKKHWRDHLKAHGMVELGNDMPEGPKDEPAITEADVAEAYEMCEQGAAYRAPETVDGWAGDPLETAMEDSTNE